MIQRSIASATNAAARVATAPELRSEILWVIATKLGDFAFVFLILKILTSNLGQSGFGEFNLAETSMLLAASALLSPVSEAFLRELHHLGTRQQIPHATRIVGRWFAVITGAVAALCLTSSLHLGDAFAVAPSTVAAAGLAFVADRWRILGLEILNIQRQRRIWAISSLSYNAVLASSIAIIFRVFDASPSTALFCMAAVASAYSLGITLPLLRRLRRSPSSGPSAIVSTSLSFGVPFAILLLFQWVQNFGDRYLIMALLKDAAAVGTYAAAYQVCGAPFTLLFRISQNLLRPIAYQRGDATRPESLWSADRVLLGGSAALAAVGILALGAIAAVGPSLIALATSSDFLVDRTLIVALGMARLSQMLGAAVQPIFAVHHAVTRLIGFRAVGSVLGMGFCIPLTIEHGILGTAVGSSSALTAYALLLYLAPGGALGLARAARRDAKAAERTSEDISDG